MSRSRKSSATRTRTLTREITTRSFCFSIPRRRRSWGLLWTKPSGASRQRAFRFTSRGRRRSRSTSRLGWSTPRIRSQASWLRSTRPWRLGLRRRCRSPRTL
eukprot:Amastigsp_a406_83.p5 type:complete len:102 gc:universal Amastigsp_a406_83:1158-853(-)